ncbi:MAG TPA: hypothetical protein VNK95_21435 [Caldilineaceae bacterium]|nr:hypothetical protein [Caldilineaceae bacterium]
MGVVDSLSAGYRFLGKRLELLLVPVLLDLLLWLAPRMSIAPLFRQLAALYIEAAQVEGFPEEMAAMSRQAADVVEMFGESSNLLDLLVSSSLLHVPSLIVTIGPISQGRILEIANPLAAIALSGGLSLAGLFLGVVYMNMLARTLPIGGGPKAQDAGEFLRMAARHWLMVLLYLILMVTLLTIGAAPALLAVAVLNLVMPALGQFLLVLFSGAVLVLFFYLYFVTAAVVMDNLPVHQAMAQSFVLVRNNFWATLGFVLLYNVISLGFALLMRQLSVWMPVGTLAAIAINAYIGSGLTMALLVFYRTRLLKNEKYNEK